MRRLEEDERHEQTNLLRLTPPQRLFLQRWIELFDREAIHGVQCRPFWREKIEFERNDSTRVTGFHVQIVEDELQELRAHPLIPLHNLDLRTLTFEPVNLAESLGAAVTALGFHHEFLFHAYKPMLYPPDIPFEERLEKLRQWWLRNARKRPMSVAYRIARTGRLPPGRSPEVQLVRWNELPEPIRACAAHCDEWWSRYNDVQQFNHFFFSVNTSNCDPVSAAATALEKYENYHAAIRGTSPGTRVIEIDDEWAFVDDPGQSPEPKTYPIHLEKDRFRLRGHYDPDFAAELSKASATDKDLEKFSLHYSNAVEDAKAGNPCEALDDIAKAIDLAYSGYPVSGSKRDWRPPRLFIEKSPILMALDWCRTHYQYVLEYALKPSFVLGGRCLFGSEYRPEKIFDLISEDGQWNAIIHNCDWDELLRYRRDEILRELYSLPTVLMQRRRQMQWDLARAVRARNLFFHRGEPLQDEYLLGVFLDAFDLILRFRVVAHKHGMQFSDLLHMAEQDYSRITSGASKPDGRLFVSFGWRRWRSKYGDDIRPLTP